MATVRPPGSRSRGAPAKRRWFGLVAATALATLAAGGAGVPSPALFAALLTGVAWALLARVPLVPARPVTVAAQAVTGVTLGSYFELEPLTALGGRWGAVVVVVGGTLAASLGAGLLVAALTGVQRPTALLGLVAGGAEGIVTVSDELGADGRLVALMQYLRMLVVVLLAPVVAALLLAQPASAPSGAGAEGAGDVALGGDLAYTAVACAGGLLLSRLVRVPAAALLGPLGVAALLTATGATGGADVPSVVQAVAFAVIGLQVGLRFTPGTLRHAGRLLPAVLGAIALLVAACAALAVPLAAATGVGFADAYLATTPGGIYAVLATAVGSGADTTFVLAVQAMRLLVMILAAPPLVRVLAATPVTHRTVTRSRSDVPAEY